MRYRNAAYGILILIFFLINNLTANNGSGKDIEGTEYLAFAEEMPKPVGGLSAIYKFIQYPEKARSSGVQGKVYVLAFINEEGGVDEVKVVKGLGAGCDEGAINAVKKTKFSAGKSSKIKMSLQIEFKLS